MAYPGVKLSTPTIYHNGQYQSDIVFNGVQWTHGTGFGDTAAEARREAIRKANNFQRRRTFLPWAFQNGVLKHSETSPSLFFHGNPARGLTLRNMALVTIKRLPGGAVAVSGRRMAGGRANPGSDPRA
jgi:hypothetical protein